MSNFNYDSKCLCCFKTLISNKELMELYLSFSLSFFGCLGEVFIDLCVCVVCMYYWLKTQYALSLYFQKGRPYAPFSKKGYHFQLLPYRKLQVDFCKRRRVHSSKNVHDYHDGGTISTFSTYLISERNSFYFCVYFKFWHGFQIITVLNAEEKSFINEKMCQKCVKCTEN